MKFDSSAYGYFFEAVAAAGSSKHGFRLARVMFVPWGWQIIDGSLNTFGWVIQFMGRTLALFEYTVDEAGRCAPEKVTVRPLAARETTPALSDPAVHWFEPRHLNAALTGELTALRTQVGEAIEEAQEQRRGRRGGSSGGFARSRPSRSLSCFPPTRARQEPY